MTVCWQMWTRMDLLFARDPQGQATFQHPRDFLPRKRATLQVILLQRKVCLRKRFHPRLKGEPRAFAIDLLGVHFFTELAALKRLRSCVSVPRLVQANVFRRTIDMEFIAGLNLRQVIGARYPVLDLDVCKRVTQSFIARRENGT